LLALGATQAHAASDITIPGPDAFPESTTSMQDGTLIIGSMAQGTIFRAAPGQAAAQPWIAAKDSFTMSVTGVLADEHTNTLWVCTNDLSGIGIVVQNRHGPSQLKSFDLHTGAAKSSTPLPGAKAFCNDIAIGPDGSAYVTDSLNPHVLRLKPGATQFEIWVETPQFGTKGAQLDGIAFGTDGNIYVDTFQGGRFFRVKMTPDGASGGVTELRPTRTLDHPDGLRPWGDGSFMMAEGGGRLDRVTIQGDQVKIDVLKDGLKGPVGAARVGRTAYVVEGQLSHLFDPDLRGQQSLPFKAIAVPWPE
jgi:sugar lactone lactonase YvrE